MSQNLAASIRQRLLNHAKAEGRLFDEVLKRYAVERFLFRLSVSDHASQFILKGAQLLRAWTAAEFRPTQDLDLLGYTENSTENLVGIVQSICDQKDAADGLLFDSTSVKAERIKEDADYQGVRVTFVSFLGQARIPLQIDVGFNDIVTPGPEQVRFPVILDHPAPMLRGYTPQTVIAEKLEAMVVLGERNSRMKDFYDLLLLSRTYDFRSADLREAVERTFDRRNTALPKALPALLLDQNPVSEQKQTQWAAFRKKSRATDTPETFKEVAAQLGRFLEPVLSGRQERNPVTKWTPKSGWATTLKQD